jgi:hypothetical protein
VALDGTGYCAAKPIHWTSCRHKGQRQGTLTYYPPRWGAALLHPDVHAVLPWMPEPIVKPDGTDNNAGERHAAQRWVAQLRPDHPHLKCMGTDARLRANAPPIETRQEHAWHSSLGGKAGAHASLCQQVQAAEQAGRVTDDERHDRTAGLGHRFRLGNTVPLHESNADIRVNGLAYGARGADRVQHLSGVTD